MAIKIPPLVKIPEADEVPYNDQLIPTNLGDDVQEAIDNLYQKIEEGDFRRIIGCTYGRSGTINAGTYLLNETVPSNISGRTIFLSSGTIADIAIANENINTFSVSVEEHDGVTYTLLTTVSVTAAKIAYFTGLSIPVTTGKQLAVKVSSGSAKNLVVSVQLRGLTE